jgi:hypothetical protein
VKKLIVLLVIALSLYPMQARSAGVGWEGIQRTTNVGTPGVDSKVPTEKAVRTAINAYPASINAVTGTGTQYFLPYWTSTGVVGKLAALGTAGSLLKSAGAGAPPAWTTETFAAPGAVGAVLYSDGTNWIRSATPTFTTINGHTLTAGSSTFTGTAGQTYTFPTTTATLARTDAAQTFTGEQTIRPKMIYVSHGASENANASDMYGQIHLITGAYTVTVPAVVVGMNARFRATTAAVACIDVQAADSHVLAGTALTAGYKICSDGYAGSEIELDASAANSWRDTNANGLWVDSGA